MAVKKTQLYASLWASCDKLRGGMDSSEYKDYILTLLFMKYVTDKFKNKGAYEDIKVFDKAHDKDPDPEKRTGCSFDDFIALKGKKNIGEGMDKIIARLADENTDLKGVIDIAHFNDEKKLGSGKEMVDKLTDLISIFQRPELDFSRNKAEGDDIIGDAYEYLMRKFATESGKSNQGNPLFEANPGGAPCNALAMLTKLGHKTAFIGKVGEDFFGEQLRDAITEVGIDASGLCTDKEIHTTLAMVHTYPDGDRDFSFYRNPGADMMLNKEEICEELIKETKIFHFGTLSMTHEGVREATKEAIRIAEESGAIISFDPNLRPPLWNSLDEAKEQVLYGLGHCQILKISDNEIQWLTGEEDYTAGVNWIRERYQIPLILVSMGKEGSRAYYNGSIVEVKPFLQKNTIETTGAGDTFCGCVLHYICEHGMEDLKEENLKDMLTFANAAASVITTRKGALRVMPTREEVQNLLIERAAE